MGEIVAIEEFKPQCILVLANQELSWIKAARQLEMEKQGLFASYYLLDQIPMLKSAGLLGEYDACVVADSHEVSPELLGDIEWVAEQMPLVLLKPDSNVYDLKLEKLCFDSLTNESLDSIYLPAYLRQGIKSFSCKAVREHYQAQRRRSVGGEDIFSAVMHADLVDAESYVEEIIDSLKVVARTRGIDLRWSPLGVDKPVLINKLETKNHFINLLLQIFDIFGRVKVHASHDIESHHRTMWLDVDASSPRFTDELKIAESAHFQGLKSCLNLNQGDLHLMCDQRQSLTLRME